MDRAQLRQREERIAELARSFMEARSFFVNFVEPYGHGSRIDFPTLHEFVELDLFNLKEECHLVFRPREQSAPSTATTGVLFDILIGSIFHEMMKVKENIYHLEVYAPMVERLTERARNGSIPQFERDFIRAYRRIERRARGSLRTDIQGIAEIFRDAADNLRTLLRENRHSSLLPRVLIENEDLVRQTYGENGLDETLSYMFDGDLAEAFLTAGRDFLEGGWYDKADAMFDRALSIDPSRHLAVQLKKRVAEALAEIHTANNNTLRTAP